MDKVEILESEPNSLFVSHRKLVLCFAVILTQRIHGLSDLQASGPLSVEDYCVSFALVCEGFSLHSVLPVCPIDSCSAHLRVGWKDGL